MGSSNAGLPSTQAYSYAGSETERVEIQGGERGVITDIQRYSVHDGPGIRTLVFFKGCPLRCIWCQNPEGYNIQKELLHREERCIKCGYCVKNCDRGAISVRDGAIAIDRAECDLCGKCVETCYAGSMDIAGRLVSVDDVVREAMKDEMFYKRSGGGVTLSGGEVTMQPRFAAALLRKLRDEGISTAIETSGYCSRESLRSILEYTDIILFDVKLLDDEGHKKYTGVSNVCIQENLHYAAGLGKKLIVRVPLIPGINDSEEQIAQTARLAKKLNAQEMHILPFHQAGKSKWSALDREYLCRDMQMHDRSYVERISSVAAQADIQVNIGGGGSVN